MAWHQRQTKESLHLRSSHEHSCFREPTTASISSSSIGNAFSCSSVATKRNRVPTIELEIKRGVAALANQLQTPSQMQDRRPDNRRRRSGRQSRNANDLAPL